MKYPLRCSVINMTGIVSLFYYKKAFFNLEGICLNTVPVGQWSPRNIYKAEIATVSEPFIMSLLCDSTYKSQSASLA